MRFPATRTLSALWVLGALLADGLVAQSGDARLGEPEPIELEIPIFAGAFGTGFYEETAAGFAAMAPDMLGPVRVRIHGDPRMHD